MRKLGTVSFIAIVTLLLFSGMAASTPGQATGSDLHKPADAPSWCVVPSPSLNNRSALSAVTALSPSDVWAVGSYYNGHNITLVEHWNGTSWNVVPSPNPSNDGNVLRAVTAISQNDVWVVGFYDAGGGSLSTLVEHWNGTSWSVIPSPNPDTVDNRLSAVTAISPNDVWAVGSYEDANFNFSTLVEHWNGTSWNVVPSPRVGGGLYGVSAISSSDVWAVGYNSGSNTLVEHWNGTSWNVVPSPIPGSDANGLSGVTAISSSDVWAVGEYYSGSNYYTLVEHWNGTSWSVVPSPSPSSSSNFLEGVTAISSSDVWAVGEYYSGSNYYTLVGHWNGTSWSVVPSPSPSSSSNILYGVTAISSSDVWAVGYYDSGSNYYTLVEHYSTSGCGTPTPIPPATPTPTDCSIGTSAQGDDVYTLDVPSNCTGNLSGDINISRFYGPLTDPNAATGTIRSEALGVTVDRKASLKITYESVYPGEIVTVNFAGVSFVLRPTENSHNTVEQQIDPQLLTLPSQGRYEYDNTCQDNNYGCIHLISRIPNALNHLTITRSGSPGFSRIDSVRLELPGMRPLVLAGGFNLNTSNPDHYMECIDNSYFQGAWPTPNPICPSILTPTPTPTPSSDPFASMLFRPRRDGHDSITHGGNTLGDQISVVKAIYGVSKVNILGHSLGGLWGREFALNYPDSVDKLMMLGTPNSGSFLADGDIAYVVARCFIPGPDCDSAFNWALRRSPALFDMTSGFMRNYNSHHGAAPGVSYIDQAGRIIINSVFGWTVSNDGAVSVGSVQALNYSNHLNPINKLGFVHNLEPNDPAFKNALDPFFSMGGNNYRTFSAKAQLPQRPSVVAPEAAGYRPVIGSVRTGQTVTGTVQVDNASSVSFALGWLTPTTTLSLNLVDPNGTVITPTSTYSGSGYLPTLNGVMYTITNPLAGSWQVQVTGDNVAGGSEPFYVSGSLEGGVQITPNVPNIATLSQPLTVGVQLADSAPISGAVVTASVSLPTQGNWDTATITLNDQGGGTYQGSYTPTMTGTYQLLIYANGVNSEGQSFSRTQSAQFMVGSGAQLTGSYSEQAVDTDGNGLFNQLVITATAQVSQAGVYRLGGYLTKADGTIITYASGTYTLPVGIQPLALNFDGSAIGQAIADGPYRLANLYFARVDGEELGLAFVPQAYTTQGYSRYAWERQGVLLAAPPTEHGVDTNGNGLYDYLETDLTLDVRAAGTYSVSLNLAAPDGHTITSIYTSTALAQGTNQLALRFDGRAIGIRGIDGPYTIADLNLSSPAGSSYIATVLPQTAAYHASDFEGGATCPVPFTDIGGNIFYVAIQHLYCAGVVNGTDASHYSPAGTSTRAQFAKVVVLGFGLPLTTPPGSPTFTDVPPSYFAYVYIETGYAAGVLSGFDQNSCAAHNATYPCYLPNIPITRGQLTKLVVNAAHYLPVNPGTPTFSDVPHSNVFYVAIETAHAKGVINGYSDGTFRPNNNIRRDEMAQIVYKGVTTP